MLRKQHRNPPHSCGGARQAIVQLDDYGLPFDRKAKNEITAAGLATMQAINATDEPVHPEDPRIRGVRHVYFAAPGSDASYSRHAMSIYPGWFDRSPCGTGTSARMAQLHARGELELGADFVNESFIGSQFTGRLVEETTVADRRAVVPTVTGRAWITGTAQYFLSPDDPFPAGFEL
ncbi:proline racemase family protein [Nonomuraea sp. NPDC005983]|uniref:proline racemase family protein n=1 Tax=Nonomuraea sp. NPDC005983 TaxID=3155595 RepID=UPI0033B8577D